MCLLSHILLFRRLTGFFCSREKIMKCLLKNEQVGNAHLSAKADKDIHVFFPSYWMNKNGGLMRCILMMSNAYGKAKLDVSVCSIPPSTPSSSITYGSDRPSIPAPITRAPTPRIVTGPIVDDQLIGTNDPLLVQQYTVELRLEFKKAKSPDNVKLHRHLHRLQGQRPIRAARPSAQYRGAHQGHPARYRGVIHDEEP